MGQIKNIKLHIVTDIKTERGLLGLDDIFIFKMVKRKVSMDVSAGAEELQVNFQVKRKRISVSGSGGKLDSSSPTNLFQSLLGETTLDDFFATYWEKKPLVVRRNDAEFYGGIFSLATMKEVLKGNELYFEGDVNVCRYVNNDKELMNEDRQITADDVDELMQQQATFQFHHPQRYVDELWNAMEKLETYFGSLVGSNVYITPKDSQGLAPHCDDVEIFVMQLEGKKEWKLYKPMVELSRDYTQDLLQEDIGEPILEVTLEAGDMLYFPRGVIHQAKTIGDSHSTHISVSTYQQNTWGDFMNHAVTQAIEKGLEEDVSIRSGLPINYLSMLGTGKNIGAYVIDEEGEEKNGTKHSNLNEEKVKEFKESVKKQLSKLIDYIDVNKAADAMCSDFMASRLPPYGHVKPQDIEEEEEEEPVILLDDKIKIKYPDHVRVVYDDEEENEDQDEEDDDWEDMEEDEEKPAGAAPGSASKSPKKSPKKNSSSAEVEDEDDEDADVENIESHIRIVHSLGNDRFLHMGPGMYDEQFGDMKLHVSFAKAAVELLSTKDFVCVKDIQMEDEKDRLFLANALFEHKLIELQPAAEE